MGPRFVTPYYVHGRSASRWHAGNAEKATMGAVALGTGAALLHHPHTSGMAVRAAASKGYHIHPNHAKAFGTAVGIAAGGTAAYAGFHAYRAHSINKGLKQKKMATTARKKLKA